MIITSRLDIRVQKCHKTKAIITFILMNSTITKLQTKQIVCHIHNVHVTIGNCSKLLFFEQ